MNLSREELLPRLRDVGEYEFEELVADVWEQRGWKTRVTTASNDHGIDVICEQTIPFSQKQVIQAKRYSADNKIGVRDIREYNSIKDLDTEEDNVDTVVIVTTSSFTSTAQREANQMNVKLVDGDNLCEMILDLSSQRFLSDYLDKDSNNFDSQQASSSSEQQASDTSSGPTKTTRDRFLSELEQMDGDEFNKLVSDLWEQRGWNTESIIGSVNGSFDVEANKNDEKNLIKIKKYSTESIIGDEDIRKFIAAIELQDNVDAGVFVTVGSFTSLAERTINNSHMKFSLIDGETLYDIISDLDSPKKVLSDYIEPSSQATEKSSGAGSESLEDKIPDNIEAKQRKNKDFAPEIRTVGDSVEQNLENSLMTNRLHTINVTNQMRIMDYLVPKEKVKFFFINSMGKFRIVSSRGNTKHSTGSTNSYLLVTTEQICHIEGTDNDVTLNMINYDEITDVEMNSGSILTRDKLILTLSNGYKYRFAIGRSVSGAADYIKERS